MKTVWHWSKNNWLLLVKVPVLVLSLWFLYAKIFAGGNWEAFTQRTQALLQQVTFASLLPVLLLMFVNWGLEALKWKILVSRFERVSFWAAFRSVYVGVFISLFVNILVPNRIGEFAGRILYVKKLNKIKAALIASIGSFSQLAVTILVGGVAYLVFWEVFLNSSTLQYTRYLLAAGVLFSVLLVLLLYFNINVLSWLLSQPRWLRRFKKITSVFYFYDSPRLLKVFLLSALRYGVFCSQFILLLWVCDIPISATSGWMIVPVIFLVQTIIPSNALSDLGVRGAAAVHFLNYYTANDAGILAAAYLVWAINILLPGLIGGWFFMVFKYRQGNGNN